jgi:TolB protein
MTPKVSEHRSLGHMLAALGIALFSLTSCGTSSPEASERIAFTSRRDGTFSIYTVRPDGSGLKRAIEIVSVEDGPKENWLDELGQPTWSPDGSKIAFTCGHNGQSEICVANGDGSNAKVLVESPTGPDRYPAWSPDGTEIAFTRFAAERQTDIMVVSPTGTNARVLVTGLADVSPTWSPDGSKIAFMGTEGGLFDIYVMDADGSDVHNITNTPHEAEGQPAWSPDGHLIAFVVGAEGMDVFVMNPDGTGRTDVTSTSTDNEAWPTWSPDGTELAFMGGPGSSICVIGVDGTNRRTIIEGHELNMQPAWGPRVGTTSL